LLRLTGTAAAPAAPAAAAVTERRLATYDAAMTEPVLSTRALNRALLARQLLLERSPLPVTDALEQLGGLQTQYAPSGYIGLWSRLRDFRREALTEALVDRRVIQGTLIRSTIHIVCAADWPLFAAGTRNVRREWWLRASRSETSKIDVESVLDRVRKLLAEGPRRQAEMVKLLEAETNPRFAWITAAQLIDMVRVPPSGTWERRRADVYGLADDWIGRSSVTEDEGREHLVRRYLGGFGPAPLTDIANWAGMTAALLRPVVERVELRRLRDEQGRELFDLPDAPLPDPDTPAPVRFLPTWDATLLVHARRTLILPEAYRPLVFNTKTPHSVPTFLVDGAVAGTWRHEKGRIEIKPFGELSTSARRELDDEAERLAAFHAD
jgi:Winged helix DNA-binding domain